MTTQQAFAYQVSTLPTSFIPKIEDFFANRASCKDTSAHKISAFNEPVITVKEPKLAQWEFLDQENVEKLFKFKTKKDIIEFIGSHLKIYPKGRCKDIFIELLYDVTQFCQNLEFDVEKSGTVLSQIYLTHLYFISRLDITAEKLYIYFKHLMLCHSMPFPPSSKKVFNLREARDILEFFCKIYLRNLPLIRYLCLPNFALYLNYEIPPPPVNNLTEKKGKKGKEKADKKTKKKK